MPPTIGLSQKSFRLGQQQNFKVYGDDLTGCSVTSLQTSAVDVNWTNISSPGNGQHHVNVQATPVSTTPAKIIVTDATGDLTVTLTDVSGSTATASYAGVAYTP